MNDDTVKTIFFRSFTSVEAVNLVLLSVPLGIAKTVMQHNGVFNLLIPSKKLIFYSHLGRLDVIL